MLKRLLRLALTLIAIVGGYVVVASVVAALLLNYALSAGNVDWSGETRKPWPTDPVEIGYRGDPRAAFGYDFETVNYPTELGPAEAWWIPAEHDRGGPSAIFVHGIGGIRENGYRMLKILHEQHVPVLMITYRNDAGAPRSATGLYSFGLTEWPDVEAAVHWLAGRTGGYVMLVGESMGGAMVGQYLAHEQSSLVVGLALDAPALDVPRVLKSTGARYWVPLGDAIVTLAIGELALWRGLDLSKARSLDAVAAFKGPIFDAHGSGDPLVPVAISDELAAARPDALFFRSGADQHPLSYKSDPVTYRALMLKWLEQVRASSTGATPADASP